MFELRDALVGEELEVARVHVRSWQAAYRGLIDQAFLDSLRAEERARGYRFGASDPGAPRTIVALREGRIFAFAATSRSRDADAPDAGELCALYVDPSCWRTGVGALLLERACERMRSQGFAEAILWVLIGNTGAERFYEAHGWRADGARRDECVYGVESTVRRYRRALGAVASAPEEPCAGSGSSAGAAPSATAPSAAPAG